MLTKAIVIALPLYLALKVKLPLHQRLALGAVFSLGIFVMIFAIVRIVVTNSNSSHPDPSWLNIWSQVEAAVALIVSSLAPFKVFFTQRKLRMAELQKSSIKGHSHPSSTRDEITGESRANGASGQGDRELRHALQKEDPELYGPDLSEKDLGTRSVDVGSLRLPINTPRRGIPAVMKSGVARFAESTEDL